MGRKQRKNRRKGDDDDDDDLEEGDHHNNSTEHPRLGDNKPTDPKDLDFAQRRDLQRQQAAEKRRSKMKCYLCGRAGHVRRECPGVQDDGRGMSRYKGKSNAKHEKQKYQAAKKRSGSMASSTDDDDNENGPALLVEYAEGFVKHNKGGEENDEEDWDFYYYDAACDDIAATIQYIKEGRGKAKLSKKEATLEYQQALQAAEVQTHFGGMISKAAPLKPNRPWILPSSEESTLLPHKTWYLLGLSRDFLYHDTEVDAAVATLVETLARHQERVVGFWAVLDYRPPQCQQRPGCDKDSQYRRVRATCVAAGQAGVTVQLQVLPGAPSTDPDAPVAGTDYAAVLLDLQMLLTEMIGLYPTLTIVLSNWSGLAKHMLTFLEAFSKDNLVIGLDGAVSFSKASNLHECAFEVPLDRLVLQTATVIPSEIANALGRDAFYHAGLWPFVAKAVAHYKKTVSVLEVARATSELTLKLYPQLAPKVATSSRDDIILLDGGNGHELKQRGVITDDNSFLAGVLANENEPAVVKAVHHAFCQSGCRVLTTNSFVAVPQRVQQDLLTVSSPKEGTTGGDGSSDSELPTLENIQQRTRELISAAIKCARDVANETRESNRGEIQVAGTVPPLTECYMSSLVPQEVDVLVSSYVFLLSTLLEEEGVDLLLAETLSTAREGIAIVRALSQISLATKPNNSMPLWLSFTIDDFAQPTVLRSGESLEKALDSVLNEAENRGIQLQAIGVNCASPGAVSKAIPCLVDAAKRGRLKPAPRILAYANAFQTTTLEWLQSVGKDDSKIIGKVNDAALQQHMGESHDYDEKGLMLPEVYAKYTAQWRDMGASIIGGCCGCSPLHIQAVASKLVTASTEETDQG